MDWQETMSDYEELRAQLAAARDERDWRRDLYIGGPDGGWCGGDALENAHQLEQLTELIRALEAVKTMAEAKKERATNG